MYLLTKNRGNHVQVPRRPAVEDTNEYPVTRRWNLWGKSPDTGQRLPWRSATVAGSNSRATTRPRSRRGWGGWVGWAARLGHGVRRSCKDMQVARRSCLTNVRYQDGDYSRGTYVFWCFAYCWAELRHRARSKCNTRLFASCKRHVLARTNLFLLFIVKRRCSVMYASRQCIRCKWTFSSLAHAFATVLPCSALEAERAVHPLSRPQPSDEDAAQPLPWIPPAYTSHKPASHLFKMQYALLYWRCWLRNTL